MVICIDLSEYNNIFVGYRLCESCFVFDLN